MKGREEFMKLNYKQRETRISNLYRNNPHIRQEDIARLLGINVKTVSKYLGLYLEHAQGGD